jgi:hypothetical protein
MPCMRWFSNLSAIFAAGRVVGMSQKYRGPSIRHTCAALLPALAERLNNFWGQLRKADCDPSEK